MSFALPVVLALLVAVSQFVDNPEDLGKEFARAQRLLASGDFDGARRAYAALLEVEDQALLQASKVQVVVDEEAVGLQAAARYQLANLERRRAKLLREEADLADVATADSLEDVALQSLRIAAAGFAALRDDAAFELRERAAFMVMDCLFEAQDHEGVTASGEALLRLFPSGRYAARARYTLGWSYFELGRYEESADAFAWFLAHEPGDIQADRARLQRGLGLELLSRLPEALDVFTGVARAYDPTTMSHEEKTQVALAGLREGTSRRSIAAKAWLKRGDVLKATGDADGALEAYRRVTEGFPEEERLAEMAWVRQALLAGDTGGTERAAQVYRHAIEQSSRPGFRARMLAGEMTALFDAGRYAESLERHRAYLAEFFGDEGPQSGAVIAEESGVRAEEAWFRVGDCLRLLADAGEGAPVDSLRRSATAAYGRALQALADGAHQGQTEGSLAPDALLWRGFVFQQLGEADSARAEYGQVRAKYPGTDVACQSTLQLARLQRETGGEAGEALLREMLSSCGDDAVRGLAALELGRLYRSAGRVDEAREVLAAVEPESPQYARARLELAQALLQGGDEAAAAAVLGEELARLGEVPDEPETGSMIGQMQAQLGLLHQRRGEHVRALGLLRRGLERVEGPARAGVRFAIGWSLYEQHRYEEAWAAWTAALREEEVGDAERARLLRGIGLCAQVLERIEEAVSLYAQAADGPGAQAEGRLALGQLHLDGGRLEAAIEAVRSLLAGDVAPEVALRAGLLTAKARLAQERYGDALELLQGAATEVAGAAPEVLADLQFTRGSATMGLGQYADAAEAFRRTLELAAERSAQATALYYQAQALWAGGEVASAREAFARVAGDYATQPRAAEAALTVAELYYGDGDYESAAQWYARVHETWPESEHAPSALYGAAWCRLEQGDAAAMDSLFLALAEEYPEDDRAAQGLMDRADFHYNAQDFARAAPAYAQVVERFPQSALVQDAGEQLAYLRDREADGHYQAAMVLYDAREYERAIPALAWIVAQYPETASEAAARCNIAMAYQQMAEYRRAMATYDEAVAALEGREDAEAALAFAKQNLQWIAQNVFGEAIR